MRRRDGYGLQGGPLKKFNLLVKIERDVQYKTASRSGEGFFSVHWEIQHRRPEFVRLHVESPDETHDKDLNELKVSITRSLLNSDLVQEAEDNSLKIDEGPNVRKEWALRGNKSTEVYKIELDGDILHEEEFARIMFVDNILGLHVQEVLYQFGDQIVNIFKR